MHLKSYNISMRSVITILIAVFVLVSTAFAEVKDWLPKEITTPLELSVWMMGNLDYIDEPGRQDVWKTPEQTVKDKGGDCEDFAILTKAVFEYWGIKGGQLAIVVMKDPTKDKPNRTVGHMIFVWRMPSGNYWHMSNQYIVPSSKQTMAEMLDGVYPEWTRFSWQSGNSISYYAGLNVWQKKEKK